MDATLVEKIIAAHCGRECVSPGEEVRVAPDLVVLNEPQAEAALEAVPAAPPAAPFLKERLVIATDRFAAAADPLQAGRSRRLRAALAAR